MGVSESMRHTFVFVLLDFNACLTHGIGTRLELTVKRVSCSVCKECGRDFGRLEFFHIGRCYAQTTVEGVNHSDGADIGRNLIECIGTIVGSECRTVYQFIEIESFIATKDASGRESYGGYVIRIYPIIGSVPTDKTDSTSQVEASFLHRIGTYTIVYDKSLITVTGKPLCDRSTFHLVAAELKRTACAYEDGTLYRHAFRNRKKIHIRAE